jgi:hypothetical protein
MVSSEGLLWYIFPVKLLVGFFLVKLFFPAKKAQDDRREVVARCADIFLPSQTEEQHP